MHGAFPWWLDPLLYVIHYLPVWGPIALFLVLAWCWRGKRKGAK
jgi:hypothetical protein